MECHCTKCNVGVCPKNSVTEILKHSDIIKKKSKLASKDLQYVMDMLFSRIMIYPKDEYADYYVQAKDIMKDIDPDDAPFLALAMKTIFLILLPIETEVQDLS